MNGYGSHTFKTVNNAGVPHFVKFHFKTDQGIRNLPAAEADALSAADPDYAIRDLYNAIDSANYPSWTVYLQVMTVDQANRSAFNPFDVTKARQCRMVFLLCMGQKKIHSICVVLL